MDVEKAVRVASCILANVCYIPLKTQLDYRWVYWYNPIFVSHIMVNTPLAQTPMEITPENGFVFEGMEDYLKSCAETVYPVDGATGQFTVCSGYVVMPNHIHLIAVVDMSLVETVHAPSQTNTVQTKRWKNDVVNEKMQTISRRKNKLSFLVGSIKSNITRYANQKGIEFAWQPRFHDHIVRNIDELNNIAAYVENNVANWHTDIFHG